jgi:hypothetical protein
MSKLRVKCLKCGKEWKKESIREWAESDYSSSFCNACFREVITPVIRRKQRKEGHFDCFGTAVGDCDQENCRYRQCCLYGKEGIKIREIEP